MEALCGSNLTALGQRDEATHMITFEGEDLSGIDFTRVTLEVDTDILDATGTSLSAVDIGSMLAFNGSHCAGADFNGCTFAENASFDGAISVGGGGIGAASKPTEAGSSVAGGAPNAISSFLLAPILSGRQEGGQNSCVPAAVMESACSCRGDRSSSWSYSFESGKRMSSTCGYKNMSAERWPRLPMIVRGRWITQ